MKINIIVGSSITGGGLIALAFGRTEGWAFVISGILITALLWYMWYENRKG